MQYDSTHSEYELERVREAQEAVRALCLPSTKPPEPLEEELAGVAGHPDTPLQLKFPNPPRSSFGFDFLGRNRHFEDFMEVDFRVRFADRSTLIEHWEETHLPDTKTRRGYVEFRPDRTLEVQPGIRHPIELDEFFVAEGLYYYQFDFREREEYRWVGKTAKPDLYPRYVLPNVAPGTAGEHPIEWASKRMQVHNGYAAVYGGRDVPPFGAEFPYIRMAGHVCNPPPESLRQPRQYQLNDQAEERINIAEFQTGSSLSPEAVIFLLELAEFLDPELPAGSPALSFLKGLNTLLDHGLMIDRVVECVHDCIAQGLSSDQAVEHATNLAESIFHSKPPWWFHEDFRFCAEPSSALAQPEIARMLADCAGAAYEPAREVYQQHSGLLADLGGLSDQERCEFIVEVTRNYGIGNPDRAGRVIQFAGELLGEQQESLQSQGLSMLRQTLLRNRPVSEVIGVLEGDEAIFDKPGVLSMLLAHTPEQAQHKKSLNALSIDAADLRALTNVFQRPLLERAKVRPALRYEVDTSHLITNQIDVGALPMPVGLDQNDLAPLSPPLTGWLNFEHRLHTEVPCSRREVARLYFTFCASRMPDPFSPPEGMLSFLYAYQQISDPGYRFTALEDPRDRPRIAEENARRYIKKFHVVTTLLDAWVMGLSSWEEVKETFDWLTADISEAGQVEIQKDILWEHYWNKRQSHGWHAEHVASRDREYLEQLEHLRYQRDAHSFWTSEHRDYIEFQIDRLERRRAKLFEELTSPAEEQPEDEDYSVREVERAIDDAQDALRLSRLQRLERSLGALGSLNSIVGARVLTSQTLGRAFSATLQAIRADAGRMEDCVRTKDTLIELDAHLLARIQQAKLIDLSTIDAEPLAAQRGEEFGSLVVSLGRLCHAYKAFEERIQEANKRALHDLQRGRPDHSFAETLDSESELRAEALGFFEGIDGLDHAALQEIIDREFWGARYQRMFFEFESFQREQLLHDMSGCTAAVSESNRMMMSTWFVMAARRAERSLLQRVSQRAVAGESARTALVSHDIASNAHSFREAYAAIRQKIYDAEQAVQQQRRQSFGLLPVGGKIHVIHKIDATRFNLIKERLGFESTTFRLIHADQSMILPPMPSSGELIALAAMLDREQIIDWDHPELQIGIPGRLPPEECAYLGAAILLGTEIGVEYDERSFDTTHDSDTGFRIIVYDAGGARSEFPFSTSLGGRTDIQGRRDLGDIERFQLLGSVLSHGVTDGPFAEIAAEFKAHLKEILERYELGGVLQASWVNDTPYSVDLRSEGKKHFRQAVKPCTDAWFACESQYRETGEIAGLVGEVHNLFDWLRQQVTIVQHTMLESEEYEGQRRVLFAPVCQDTSARLVQEV